MLSKVLTPWRKVCNKWFEFVSQTTIQTVGVQKTGNKFEALKQQQHTVGVRFTYRVSPNWQQNQIQSIQSADITGINQLWMYADQTFPDGSGKEREWENPLLFFYSLNYSILRQNYAGVYSTVRRLSTVALWLSISYHPTTRDNFCQGDAIRTNIFNSHSFQFLVIRLKELKKLNRQKSTNVCERKKQVCEQHYFFLW